MGSTPASAHIRSRPIEVALSSLQRDAASGIIERFGRDFDRLWKRRAGADGRIVVGLRDAVGDGGDR